VKKLSSVFVLSAAVFLCPYIASAQQVNFQRAGAQNVPAAARQSGDAVERAAKRFGMGIEGGVGLDPELIIIGTHATFGPVFNRNLEFRPGVEFGFGEVTTMFGINLDVLYTLPGSTRQTRWVPYFGGGPNFALSHRGFETDATDTTSRFNFSDTEFNSGFNFIAGARRQNGVFFEMKATAYGVTNVRLLAGFNF
jgi:hypothetical protein